MLSLDFQQGKLYYDELSRLCYEYDLIIADVVKLPENSYTHINNGSLKKSWLDHCVASPCLSNAIVNIYIDNEDTISDHFPMFLSIDIQGLPNCTVNRSFNNNDKIRWNFNDNILKESFYRELSKLFNVNYVPEFSFCGQGCNNATHWADIENYWSRFITFVNEAGFGVFGVAIEKTRVVPGWNSRIKHLYRRSREAFLRWKRLGSPRSGLEAMSMREARADFKYAMRECRRDEEALRAEAMAEKLRDGDYRGFWKCVGGGGGTSVRPDRIDGAVGDESIANIWARKFGGVLNCVKDDHFKEEFYTLLNKTDDVQLDPVNIQEIKGIIGKLKLGKSVGLDNIPNEFYLNSPQSFIIVICNFINAVLNHQFVPECVSDSKIIPLVKGKYLDFTVSDNYRPITISTTISKIIESVLYTRMSDRLKCVDNQYGYKEKSATDLCIFTLKECINMYHSLNTPVFICFIDVRSAFDRVSYWKLFTKLLKRGVPAALVKILAFWYNNQSLSVLWNGYLSHKFYMTNGIRQGALSSPFLYNVFCDTLNVELNNSSLGCCIGNKMLNNLSWADDMVVMSPSSHALNEMLAICDNYADDHLILYNTKKTKCMVVQSRACFLHNLPNIMLSGKILNYVKEFTYLGHIISDDLTDDADIRNQNRKMCARGNMVARKYKAGGVEVKRTLFQAFCYNIYGCALWSRFKQCNINRLRVNYNNILRQMLNVRSWESASQMFVSNHLRGFQAQRRCACYSLMSRVLNSENGLVKLVINSDARALSHTWNMWHNILYN